MSKSRIERIGSVIQITVDACDLGFRLEDEVEELQAKLAKTQAIADGPAVKWNAPDKIPEVARGTEELFWVAADSKRDGKVYVFLAHYQNRPLELDKYGEPIDWDCLIDPDGDPIESIGWMDCQTHSEYDNYYSPIDFTDEYKLVGWGEYTPPPFTGVVTAAEELSKEG